MPPRRAYRIGDPDGLYPVFSPEGARLNPGRWHTIGQEVIYASAYYSTALLEQRAYLPNRPRGQCYVEITIAPDASWERLDAEDLPGWDQPDSETARTFGTLWIAEKRTAILVVPSAIAPIDNNVLLNPNHPDVGACVSVGPEQEVRWDERLF